MSIQFADLARRVAEDGQVTAEELFSLRQLGWGDGKIFREEAEAIFAINDTIHERTDEWVEFFVEAIGEFVLNGTEPRNMCSEEEARWLIGRIDPKMDRKKNQLNVMNIYAEPDAPQSAATGRAVAAAIEELATFVGAKEIVYGQNVPVSWAKALQG